MKVVKNNKTLLIHADEQGLSQRLMPIHMYTKKHYKKKEEEFSHDYKLDVIKAF